MNIYVDAIDVKLVNATSLDFIVEAWQFSRPADTKSTLLDIVKIDLPVLEFAQFQVQFYVPILLREYICTARNHVVWARTSRVDDLSIWPVFCINGKVEALYDKCQEDFRTMHQDQARLNLPLGYMTRFSASLNFRDYFNLVRVMLREGADAEDAGEECIAQMFKDLAVAMLKAVGFIDIPILDEMTTKKTAKSIVGKSRRHGYRAKADSDFVTITINNMPIALRAQLVRHRPAMVSDNLRDFFNDAALTLPISTEMGGSFVFKRDDAMMLVRTRNCWIAQEGLWSEFLGLIRFALDEDSHPLPCDNGTCPYARDNQLRLEGKDPAPPCPKYAQLNKEPLSLEHANAAATYAKTRSDTNFWLDILVEKEVTP